MTVSELSEGHDDVSEAGFGKCCWHNYLYDVFSVQHKFTDYFSQQRIKGLKVFQLSFDKFNIEAKYSFFQ